MGNFIPRSCWHQTVGTVLIVMATIMAAIVALLLKLMVSRSLLIDILQLLLLCSPNTTSDRDTWMKHRSQWFLVLSQEAPSKGSLHGLSSSKLASEVNYDKGLFVVTCEQHFPQFLPIHITFLAITGYTMVGENCYFWRITVVDGVKRMHLLPLPPAVLPTGVSQKDKTSWLKKEAETEPCRCCMTKNVVWSLRITVYNRLC